MRKLKIPMNKEILAYIIILAFSLGLVLISGCDSKLVSIDLSDAPYDLTLIKTAEGQIRITWLYNVNSEDTIRYSISKKIGNIDWISNYAFTYNNFFSDNIPTNDTIIYAYRVKAYNESTDEESDYSETIAYFSEFTQPTNILIQQISQSQLRISWQDHSIGEEGFYVDKKIDDGNWQIRYRVYGTNVNFFDDPAELFQTVSYRIYAFSGISTSLKSEASYLTTLLPPTDLFLQKPDPAKIRVNWTDNSDHEEGFYIDKKIGEQEWINEYTVVDSNITSWIDDIDLPCGTFSYRVRAFSGAFSSPYSNEEKINIYLEEIGNWDTAGEPADVFISEDTNWYSFIADKYYGFCAIDCVNPSAPFGMNYNQGGLPDRTLSVFVRDDLAYLTTDSGLDEHGMLYIVDLSPFINFHPFELLPPPEVLYIVGSCPITADEDDTYTPYDIYLDGDFAYVADGENGLVVIYIASSNPAFVAECQTGGVARNVFVKNNKAYVAAREQGLVVVNIMNPYNPFVETTYPTSGLTMDVKIRDNHAYIADGENGLKIINLSTTQVDYISTGGFTTGVYVQGQDRYDEDHVYLIDREKGLYVIDITQPGAPYILGHMEMDTEPVSISKFFLSSYVFIADNTGLKIIQIAP
ncbi:MAG: hypothetical protein JXB60_01905 [Candidatus Cloacimonetes bacterium]|nr:hypothetical protein [Candidatus Cloacimonadota bacterium]